MELEPAAAAQGVGLAFEIAGDAELELALRAFGAGCNLWWHCSPVTVCRFNQAMQHVRRHYTFEVRVARKSSLVEAAPWKQRPDGSV